jgi:hypothetical protein
MEFEPNEAHRFDQFLSIDKGMAVLFFFSSHPICKHLRSNPKIDVASIYELSVIVAPITFVMHGFSSKV